MMIFRLKQPRFQYVPKQNPKAWAILLFWHWGIILTAPAWVVAVKRTIQKFLPSFWAVGLCDCDTGGRVFKWYVVAAVNAWHLNKIEKQFTGAGDGEEWLRISLREYLGFRRTYGRSWAHVDEMRG